ncbi:hypothetical protein TWF481_004469 [Arthrobotrys musiformis]|uniref:Kelch repeat-containing protein n=1 Tax=Arthrobotrys musiformis TaxID=47236 RepID=A0AAV9WLN8_9PEZI
MSDEDQLYDPVSEYCSLYHHAAVVVENQLYIAQGYAQYVRNSKRKGGGNPHLRFINLDRTIPVAQSGEFINVVTNSTAYPENLPSTVNPALWYNPNAFSLYMAMGGTINFQSLIFEDGAQYNPGSPREYWRSRVRTDRYRQGFTSDDYQFGGWDRLALNLDNPMGLITARNTYFDAETQKGYIVGGWVGASTNPTDSFITYNAITSEWTNSTLPWGRSLGNGAMASFRINDRLVHIHVGGYVNGTYVAMDHARIYDSETQDWYTQPIDGAQIPPARGDACTALVAAPDGSSYQMFMFGGSENGDPSARFLSDMWVLNIPSFTWVFIGESGGQFGPGARSGSSCNIVKDHIFLLYAGKKAAIASQAAQCESGGNAAYFMDLNTLSWLETYEGNNTTPGYRVASRITDVIGGNGYGGAIRTAPTGGFDSEVLATLFAINGTRIVNSNPTRLPSPVPTNSDQITDGGSAPVPTGAIVGGVVGGILLLLALIGLLVFCLRKKKGLPFLSSREPKSPGAVDDIPVGGRSELPTHYSEGGNYPKTPSIFKDPRAGYSGYYQSTVLGAPTNQEVYVYELPTGDTRQHPHLSAQELASPQDMDYSPSSTTLYAPDHELPLPPTPPGVPEPQFKPAR